MGMKDRWFLLEGEADLSAHHCTVSCPKPETAGKNDQPYISLGPSVPRACRGRAGVSNDPSGLCISVQHMLQLPLLCEETRLPALVEPLLHVGCAHEGEHIQWPVRKQMILQSHTTCSVPVSCGLGSLQRCGAPVQSLGRNRESI